MTKHTLFLAAALGLLACPLTPQADARIAPRPTGVIGVDSNQLTPERSEEHTSELQSLMRLSYAVFCLKKNNATEPTRPYQLTRCTPRTIVSSSHTDYTDL